MRYVTVGRATAVGVALLLFLSVCSPALGAKRVIAAEVVTLRGTINVTKADGTTEVLKDRSKPIVLPATIEMVGAKGSFWISLPSRLTGKFNTLSWTMRKGETVRVSVLKSNRGVRFEYTKGTRTFFLDVNDKENVLLVRSVKGTTTFVLLQNKVTVLEEKSALLTCPMNAFALVTVLPGQVSEIEFDYSPEDQFIQVVRIEGTFEASRRGRPLPGPLPTPQDHLIIPVPPPPDWPESPFLPRK